MGRSSCAIKSCRGYGPSTVTFPNPKKHWKLFLKWIDATGLDPCQSDVISKRKRICLEHFKPEFRSSPRRRSKIIYGAYPTLKLPKKISFTSEETPPIFFHEDIFTSNFGASSHQLNTSGKSQLTNCSNEVLKDVRSSLSEYIKMKEPVDLKVFPSVTSASNMSSSPPQFEALAVTNPKPFVYQVELNRPEKMNALNHAMWMNIGQCLEVIAEDPNCRVVLLTGSGKIFCAGIDFKDVPQLLNEGSDDVARRAKNIAKLVSGYQQSLSWLEKCRKPVVACIHGACIGGGNDVISAADIRYCTKDAWFSIKEVDLGLAADIGTLQRMPKVIGNDSLMRELIYTGRKMLAAEALALGYVSKVFDTKEAMMAASLEMAELIASKSPVAVQGSKRSLVYSRDHSVQEGLDDMVIWQQCMLQSEDLPNAAMAMMSKQPVQFSKL